MIAFLKLIRFPNLLVIAFVQGLMRYAIMLPVLRQKGYELQMSGIDFFLLVVSTMLLAAAGYVINDYFDRKSDMINNPGSVIVEKKVGRRWAMLLHILLNVFAISIGFYLSYIIGSYKIAIIYLIIPALLWYYSTIFKSKLFVGNIIIAGFIAIVPLLVPLFEMPLIRSYYNEGIKHFVLGFDELFEWIIAFSVFSFLMILIYKTLKEIVNIEGDTECNRRTLPIVFGITTTKYIISFLSIITIFLSAGFLVLNMWNLPTITYYLALVFIPFIIFIYKIIVVSSSDKFRNILIYPRIIMIFGMLYTLVVYYLIIY